MKKQLTIIIISSVIAMILCGCGGGGDTKENSASAEASSASGTDSSNYSSTSGENENSTGKSKTPAAEDSAEAGDASQSEVSAAAQQSIDEKTDEASEDENGIVYNEDGEVTATSSKYVSTSQMTVDISDSVLASSGAELETFFVTSKKELDAFYGSNKDKYSLEKTDSGSGFSERLKGFDDTFFSVSNVLLIVQSYDKDKGLEIGDTHIEDKGAIIDIYKEQPRAPDKAAYVLNIICYSKSEIKTAPEVSVFPAGELYTDESDPDVIVSLGNDDEEESHEISVTEDGDIVYTG